MKIDRIELRQIFLPYLAPFSTSGWTEEGNHAIIVRIDAEGITAWGESPVGANPFYNEENQKTAWVIMQDYLVPMLTQAKISSPWDVTPAFARVRGNRMAQSGLEFTVWDWFARSRCESGKAARRHATVWLSASALAFRRYSTLLKVGAAI